MADGGTVGVGLMGSEGAVGLGLLSGDRRSLRTTMVQVPGTASRMDADVFQREVVEHAGEAKNVFRRFYDGFSEGVAQLAACIAMHPIEQRFAGRLLAIHDRVGRDTFPLTHEFEALMLGVRRASVTLAAAHLREIHAIDYHSGEVVITNRRILEQTACGCYDQITRIERAVYAHKR